MSRTELDGLDVVQRILQDGGAAIRWGVPEDGAWQSAQTLPTMSNDDAIEVQRVLDIDGDGFGELLGHPPDQADRWAILDPIACADGE